MLGLLIPPTIFLLEFKTKQELLSMPVTLEEHEQELAEEEEEGEEEEAENEHENRPFRSSRVMTGENGAMELRYILLTFIVHSIVCSFGVCFVRVTPHKNKRQTLFC